MLLSEKDGWDLEFKEEWWLKDERLCGFERDDV